MQNKFKIYLNSYVNGFARGTKKSNELPVY